MKSIRGTSFSKSIILKSILLLIVSMLLIVSVGTYFFNERQMEATLAWNVNTNKTQLQQMAFTANNEMEQFASRLSLLAKTSEIASMNATTAASYLKSYTISTLFISGETVSLFNREDSLICDNSMLTATAESYPIDFGRVNPHRPYITPWYRESDNTPKRAFAVIVIDRALGDGSLVAKFSFRRLWKLLSEHKVGQNGFLVAVNSAGEILYHPDLKRWLNGTHKIFELGLKNFDIKKPDTDSHTFVTLSDSSTYLINYTYNPNYDLGLISLQPKAEIDAMVSSIKHVSWIILISSIIAILMTAFWLIMMLGHPLNRLIEHIMQITNGNLDVEEIHVGNRKDEIGQLSLAFNQMHGTIKKQIQQLNSHREDLEREVRERTQELEEANRKLDLISRTDELTQLPNRRDMQKTIEKEVTRTERSHKPFSIIFFDIDHFKNVNDTYGHAAGDLILKSVASTIRSLLRKYDVLARFGGEEFLTLLPETPLEDGIVVAERFRKQIEESSVRFGGQEIKVTITLGVALYDSRLGADRSIQLADKALYEGKESGRNKVIVWDPARTTEEDYERAAKNETQVMRIV